MTTTDNDEAVVVTVLGASGDLANKKILPALFSMFKYGHLNKDTIIIGYARTPMEREKFHEHMLNKVAELNECSPELIEQFKEISYYASGEYGVEADFIALNNFTEKICREKFPGKVYNSVFYLALPPEVFPRSVEGIRRYLYNEKASYNRLVIEKPFGCNIKTCNELFNHIHKFWSEDEVYRIDHFLGKELVSGLIVLRFSNPIMKFIFNRECVDYVDVTLYENFGTEGRSGYFDKNGIIRDVMQNHMIQIFSLLAMNQPKSFTPKDIRDAKVELLKCVRPVNPNEVLIGQYTENKQFNKKGYVQDEGIAPDSRIPTFAAVVLRVDNSNWAGVPFILKCGKAMSTRKTEINLFFKHPETKEFKNVPRPNFTIRVQPGELFSLKLVHKKPGLTSDLCLSDMKMDFKSNFPSIRIPDAYENLLIDVLKGNHSNFVRRDELEYSWKIITPIIEALEKNKTVPEPYPYYSDGPSSLNQFINMCVNSEKSNIEQSPVTTGINSKI